MTDNSQKQAYNLYMAFLSPVKFKTIAEAPQLDMLLDCKVFCTACRHAIGKIVIMSSASTLFSQSLAMPATALIQHNQEGSCVLKRSQGFRCTPKRLLPIVDRHKCFLESQGRFATRAVHGPILSYHV